MFISLYNGYVESEVIGMAKKLIRLGYSYVDTIYDTDFIYDVYENSLGIRKLVIIGCR